MLELSGRRVDVEAAAREYVPHFERAVGASAEWSDPSELAELDPTPERESDVSSPLSVRPA